MHALIVLWLVGASAPARRNAADVAALLAAVVKARIAVGRVHSISGTFGWAEPPVGTICLGTKDGKDASDALLKTLPPRYIGLRLSECPTNGHHAEDRLLIGPIKWIDDDHVEVPLEGLGAVTPFAVHRENGLWRVDGVIGGIVG